MGEILKIEPREVFRYLRLGGNEPDEALAERIAALRTDALKAVSPAREFMRLPISQSVVAEWLAKSRTLARHLDGCHAVYLVCGTLGAKFDALLRKACVKSAADALVLQATGTAAIEEWMDAVEAEVAADLAVGETMLRRYSPGYGDFPLQAQKELLCLLDSARSIGVFLTETFLMVPSKSVSAVIGVKKGFQQ